MPKLMLTLDDALLGEFPLEKKLVTIGRRPTNDIHIDNLAVSGEHARIIMVDAQCSLEDLDSTNGSLVNGHAVQKQRLLHGDVITIGKYHLKFVDDTPHSASATSTDFENTIMVQPHEPIHHDGATSHVPESATIDESALPPACVQLLNGPAKGKELPLVKSLTTLGKSGDQVAVITRRPHGYFITHVEGLRHPLVNGTSIGVQATQLQDHDVIELAGVKMEFYLSGN